MPISYSNGMFGLVEIYHDSVVKRPFPKGIIEFLNEIKVNQHLKNITCGKEYFVKIINWSDLNNDMFLTMERCDKTLSNIKKNE